MLQQCLQLLLEPLKAASQTGLFCLQPDGSYRLAVPRLLSYVADTPEQRAVLQLYATCTCRLQCCRCYADNDRLSSEEQFPLRTLQRQRQIAAAIQGAANNAAASALQTQFSMHPEETGLSGFHGEHLITCDPYQVMAFDFLHNIDLGLAQLLISFVSAYADKVGEPRDSRNRSRGAGSRALKIMDVRLLEVPRSEGFYPPKCGKYFSNDAANYQGKQHRAVLQVLPSLTRGLVDEKCTEVVSQGCQLIKLMYTRRAPEEFTDASLAVIDSTRKELIATINTETPSINVNTPKVHNLGHFTLDVKNHGHPKHFNSDWFESDHIKIKAEYRGSSKKVSRDQYIKEIAYRMSAREAFAALQQQRTQLEEAQAAAGSAAGSSSSSDSSSSSSAQQQYATAYMKAADSSEHTLSSTNQTASLDLLASPGAAEGCANAQFAARSLMFRSWDPAMPQLPHRLQEFLLCDRVGNGRAYSRTNLPELPTGRIRVHTSAVLAADCPWEAGALLLQTVRANNSFHGSPFYDFVAVRVATSAASSSRQTTTEQYARLLLLFEYRYAEDGAGELAWRPLVYVQWYDKVRSDSSSRSDPLVKYGAVLLQARKVYDPATKSSNHSYGIVHLSSIIRKEYVMKDYSKEGMYHTNPFKR